jgi:adenine deaminase
MSTTSMPVSESRQRRIDAALGVIPSDLVLTGGRVINVFTKETLEQSVAVLGDRIVAVGEIPDAAVGPSTRVLDVGGAYVVPGYIDPHLHSGDTSMSPRALAVALLERGTTSLATDMCELYAVGGLPAVRWAIDASAEAGLQVLFMLPLHSMGAEMFGAFKHVPTVDEYLEMAGWPETIAVNEPPPNVVLRGNVAVLTVLDRVMGDRKRFEGHAPGLSGQDLIAYVAAGSSSDHEAVAADEALEKLRLGYRIIMREMRASRDLEALVPLIVEHPEWSRFFMVGSDDMQAKEFVLEGHIDHKLRKVVAAGVDAVTAVQLATINVAEYFGLADDLGAVSPGKLANLLVIDELETFRPRVVIAGGIVVVDDARYTGSRDRGDEFPDDLRAGVHLDRAASRATFRVPAPIDHGTARVRVIGMNDGTLICDPREAELPVRDGEILADPVHDVLKVSVLDRHHATGAVSTGFVNGYGLRAGAVASTFFWQHFSLLAVGVDDDELTAAVSAMEAIGGGLVAVRDGEVLASVAFPVGGILSTLPLDELHEEIGRWEAAVRALGSPLQDPFMSLAFTSIPHIPHYGITDRGFYDTYAEQFVDIVLDATPG